MYEKKWEERRDENITGTHIGIVFVVKERNYNMHYSVNLHNFTFTKEDTDY